MGVRIHPTALVESEHVGDGTTIWAHVHIMPGAVVGAECKIGDNSYIEGGARLGDRVTVKNNSLIWHGVTIGDEVFVGPNVVFTNDLTPRVRYQTGPEDWVETVVEDGASIGANATIVAGVRLSANSMVGAGAVVTKDVQRHALVLGNPAIQTGWVCECGTPLRDLVCPREGREYEVAEDGLHQIGT